MGSSNFSKWTDLLASAELILLISATEREEEKQTLDVLVEYSTDNTTCMHPCFLMYWRKNPLNVKTLCCCKSPSLYTIHNLSSLSKAPPLFSFSLSLTLVTSHECELPQNVHFAGVITHTRNLNINYLLITAGYMTHQLQISLGKNKSKNIHVEAQPKRSARMPLALASCMQIVDNCGQMVDKSELGAE